MNENLDCPAEPAAELDASPAKSNNPSKRDRHEALMEEHRERKNQRREDHRKRKEFRSCPPNVLI